MLIILRGEDKLRDRHDIDRLISAEIPDEEEDPELYSLVKSWPLWCAEPQQHLHGRRQMQEEFPQTLPG